MNVQAANALTSPPAVQTAAAAGGSERSEVMPLRRPELLLILGFWTFMALLTAANSMIDPMGRGLLPISSTSPIAIAAAESLAWALLTPPLFWLTSRLSLERVSWSGWLWRVLLLLLVGMAISILVDIFTGWTRIKLYVPARPDPGPLARVTRFWFINEFIVYLAILAAGFARHYFLRYRARREEAIRLQAHAAQLQAQLADARLAALRNQLDPHFLFNTLHAISALVERDPRGVRRMIARLSELLRTTLEGAKEQEVPLSQELAFLDRYLEIMQIRFQGRLEIVRHVDDDLLDALVPNLILQPLVENAIKHGIEKLDGVGRIEIRAQRDGERLVLSVRDNGPQLLSSFTPPREGVGLRNTRARLAQLYGTNHSFTLRNAEGGGLLAEVTLPYHTRADLRTTGVTTVESWTAVES